MACDLEHINPAIMNPRIRSTFTTVKMSWNNPPKRRLRKWNSPINQTTANENGNGGIAGKTARK